MCKEGLRVREDGDDGATEPARAGGASDTADSDGKRRWTKDKPGRAKKKKKKFRYETRAERKVTRGKERAGNKAKAKSRRD